MEATLNGGEWDSFITALTNEANTLTDSNNWDGPLALQFQNDTWPSVQSSLKSAQSQLNDLKSQLHTIAQNIFQAGGSN
jgi:hypothetical protein